MRARKRTRSMVTLSMAAAIALGLCLLATPITAKTTANAADKGVENPTFYKDVLPVMQANCQTCHRAGGANLGGMVAPMAFTSYEETRPWAKSIARQVTARTMPPWHASDAQHGVFVNERTMADADIQTLTNWVKSGAPAGDPADAPPAIEWPQVEGNWAIGKPDLEIFMGDKYFVEDAVEDIYVTFYTPITEEMLPEPRWVKGIEFRPGSKVVHHIVAPPLGGIAPGNQPTIYPDGYGTLLKPGDTVRWSMHYHKEPGPGTGVWDRSKVAIKFYEKGYTPEHPVLVDPLARFDFVVPPNETATFTTKTKFERDTLLMSMLPHMHLRGKSAKYIAHYPDGTQEELLEVPQYDFNWQTSYDYPADQMKRIPAGTEIEFIATWDNTTDNPFNPNPNTEVRFGEPTTDEMMFGFLTYADAESGYVPDGGGWLKDRPEMTEERMKRILKERRGIDFDSLPADMQRQVRERFGLAADSKSEGTGD